MTLRALLEAAATRIGTEVKAVRAEFVPKTLVNAKGDLIAATANDVVARLAVGSNGQVLTADSTQTTGLAWATSSGGGTGPSLGLSVALAARVVLP